MPFSSLQLVSLKIEVTTWTSDVGYVSGDVVDFVGGSYIDPQKVRFGYWY